MLNIELPIRHSGLWNSIKDSILNDNAQKLLSQKAQLQQGMFGEQFNINFITLLMVVGVHEINQSKKSLYEFSCRFNLAVYKDKYAKEAKNGLFCLLFIFGMACKKICRLGLAEALFLSCKVPRAACPFTQDHATLTINGHMMCVPLLFLDVGIKFLEHYYSVMYKKDKQYVSTLFDRERDSSLVFADEKMQVYELSPELLALIDPHLPNAELTTSETMALLPGDGDTVSARPGCCFCGCLPWLCSCSKPRY